jgi:hypothetical protein
MENKMTIRLAAASLAAASLLAIAACDSRDYEAEIQTLQSDLQSAQTENQQLQTELDGLRSQSLPEGALDNVQTELNNVVQTAATTFQQLGSQAGQEDEALAAMRSDLQTIVQSVQAAASDLGLELETVTMDTDAGATEGMAEPAASDDTQTQTEEPAAQDQQPAEPQQEQPATSQ